MTSESDTTPVPHAWPALANAGLRVAFGIIWAVNAAFVWSAKFSDLYVGYLHNASKGQPSWSAWWFDFWIDVVSPRADLFISLTRLAVTALALALLLGFARKTTYVLGALFSLLVWSTAEGFGGPYAVGASNTGMGLIYVVVFIALIAINYRSGASPYSLDFYLERAWPGWARIAEWSRTGARDSQVERVSWGVQAGVLAGISILLFFLIAGLQSTVNVKTASPEAAAAAVSPMQLKSAEPVKEAYDASLPPLMQEGDAVTIKIAANDRNVEIISGVQYAAWPYGESVPGPIIHVKQGQMIHVELSNNSVMHHSIDFHASFTPPNLSFADINPGETIKFSFEATTPGAFVYHCGTPPVLLHMANGMYGAIIVDPVDNPLPPADKEYVLVQSEWYTRQISGNLMGPDFEKMMRMQPDVMAFNGTAFQYVDHPLRAAPNERVRLYMVNAGPSLWSAFHVIGAIFDKVYPSGDVNDAMSGVSTWTVGPGEGMIFDVVIPEPGLYPFVDHSFAHLEMGAVGVLDIREPGTEHTGKPNIFKTERSPAQAAAPRPAPEAEGPYSFDAERASASYTTYCGACHQVSGTGMPGVFPPLVGNSAVLDDDPTKHLNAILHGLSGEEIDGVMYAAPMQAFGDMLTDTEVADIANHERSAWGNQAKTVTPEQVKALR